MRREVLVRCLTVASREATVRTCDKHEEAGTTRARAWGRDQTDLHSVYIYTLRPMLAIVH